MSWVRMLAAVSAAPVLFPIAPASAHGEIQGTNPKPGSRVAAVPRRVAVTLTEAPGPGSVIKAVDGCRRKVRGSIAQSGNDLVLAVSRGEPGRWTVSYRAISSVDGHLTRDRFAFAVAGRKDCSRDDTQIAGGRDTRVAAPDADPGSSFPFVPFGIATAAVLVLAFVLRRRTDSGG